MVTRSASRLWYASLRNSMLSPSRALDTDWFLQTILFGISKVVCSRLMSSFPNLQKYAAIAGNQPIAVIFATSADLKIPRID